jgi:hypothetical protein
LWFFFPFQTIQSWIFILTMTLVGINIGIDIECQVQYSDIYHYPSSHSMPCSIFWHIWGKGPYDYSNGHFYTVLAPNDKYDPKTYKDAYGDNCSRDCKGVFTRETVLQKIKADMLESWKFWDGEQEPATVITVDIQTNLASNDLFFRFTGPPDHDRNQYIVRKGRLIHRRGKMLEQFLTEVLGPVNKASVPALTTNTTTKTTETAAIEPPLAIKTDDIVEFINEIPRCMFKNITNMKRLVSAIDREYPCSWYQGWSGGIRLHWSRADEYGNGAGFLTIQNHGLTATIHKISLDGKTATLVHTDKRLSTCMHWSQYQTDLIQALHQYLFV